MFKRSLIAITVAAGIAGALENPAHSAAMSSVPASEVDPIETLSSLAIMEIICGVYTSDLLVARQSFVRAMVEYDLTFMELQAIITERVERAANHPRVAEFCAVSKKLLKYR